MESIEDLMIELDGADPETVKRIASEKGSLAVRLAMLGLASIRKGEQSLWWGYPPGVFISYKWEGVRMHNLVVDLAEYVRQQGYRAFLDVENLDQNANSYFQIPEFITSIQECSFYILLLTELSADFITARKGKMTWIFDEFQHAVSIANAGRLVIVPVLLEPKGMTDNFNLQNVIDLTGDQRRFSKLNDILSPNPVALDKSQTEELTKSVAEFDQAFLNERWEDSDQILRRCQHLGHTFDHQFRRMLLSLYTADQPGFEAVYAQLRSIYGEQIILHLYGGYCKKHNIPNRANVEKRSP